MDRVHSLSLSLFLAESWLPWALRSLTIYARLILVETHTHARAQATLDPADQPEEDLSRRDFEKSTFENPIWIVRLANRTIPLCRTELLSDGPRDPRVRLFGKQEASLRSKIGENCESLRKAEGLLFFFFFFSPFRKARPSWWDVARFTSSFIRIPFYFYFILFDSIWFLESKSDVHIIDIFLYRTTVCQYLCLNLIIKIIQHTKVVTPIRTSVCVYSETLYKSIQCVYSPKIIKSIISSGIGV